MYIDEHLPNEKNIVIKYRISLIFLCSKEMQQKKEINERNKKKLCNKQKELYKPKISKLYDFQTIKLPIG